MPGDVDPKAMDKEGKAALFDELMGDKEIRGVTLRALNKKHPEIVVPELVAEDLVNERTGDLKKQWDAFKQDQEKAALERQLHDQKMELRRKHNASDEDIGKVEKLMTERKIADYDTGFEFYRLSQAAATPTPSAFETKRLTMPDLKTWTKNPQGVARDLAEKAIQELRSKNQR